MKRYDIRRHRFLRVITKSLTAITVLTLISCQNIFTEKKVSPENTKKAKLIVTASASTVSRAAIDPQLNLSDFSEFKLYASTFDLPADLGSLTPIATGKSLEELNEPAIELDAGICQNVGPLG